MKKVKNGDEQAFKKIYNLYADYALRTTYAITRNNNHASDIVQETFVKVFRGIEGFDINKPFKPWLYQILLNESRRYMKQQNKQAIAVESEQLLDHLNKENRQELPLYDELDQALDQLSEMHRTVLVLKYINDFTEKEISQLLDLNVNTVKSRLFKGRKKMVGIMGGVVNE